MYGECLDISFLIISYLFSPAGGISPKRTVLVSFDYTKGLNKRRYVPLLER